MNVQTKPAEDAAVLVAELGRRAKAAAVTLRNASTDAKNRALAEAARLIKAEKAAILAANAKDIDAGARFIPEIREITPAIEGEFKRGDVVDVKDRAGRVLARGLVAYAADDARRIAGRKSAEIEQLLGFRGRDEIVHRDDLVVE